MTQFLTLFSVLSLVVQVVVELVQRAGLQKWTQAVACVIGFVVAVTTHTGLLAQFGVTVTPVWVDWLFLGAALAGGSWVLDLVKKLGSEQLAK